MLLDVGEVLRGVLHQGFGQTGLIYHFSHVSSRFIIGDIYITGEAPFFVGGDPVKFGTWS